MKLGIVIFPSKKLQDYANSYRKRYDPHYTLIPPHITLTDPFETSEKQATQIAKRLHLLAKKYEPIHLHAYKISSFQPVNNVIYIKIKNSPVLESLHQNLLELTNDEAEYAFVPHITVAQQLSNDEHSDVYGALRMSKVDHEEMIDRFHLLYQLENGSWTVYETVRLGEVDE